MRIRPDRLLPSLGVGALLVFAVLGATDSQRSHDPAVPASMYYPYCTNQSESASAESSFTIGLNEGFVQPLNFAGNVAACSLGVGIPYYAYDTKLDMQSWDPVALAPDPTTVALRTTTFNVSSYGAWLPTLSYVPPVVLKSLGNVAEPLRSTVALTFTNSYDVIFTGHWTANAPAGVPVGYRFGPDGVRVPLVGGPRPAISHFICGGDQALQNLYVSQSVVRADSMYGNDVSAVVQRFRVPQRVQLYWTEMAFGPVAYNNPNGLWPGEVLVLDAQGQAHPPSSATAALTSAGFMNPVSRPSWASHYDFDRAVILEPHHDYWLWVATAWDYGLYVRHHAATESVPFNAGVGETWFIKGSNPPWTLDPGNTLDFKIVGLPLDVTSVPQAPVATSSLRLRVTPNPSRGVAMVAWSGGRGAVRFDVLDGSGRRVARGEAAGVASGQWLFRGVRDDGRALAAGVYFVRATDAGGQAAFERVVVVK